MTLSLRKVTKEDIDLIFGWANDPVTRAASFNTAQIPYEDHVKWFSKVLGREDVDFFVAMDKDLPVGQMRIDFGGNRAELSYSIAPSHRQKGYGGELIACTLQYIKSNIEKYNNLISVTARVKPENIGSSRMLVSNGFVKRAISDSYTEYVYAIRKRLYIRTDMNPIIATGHVMRCLSIADAAKNMGVEVTFISADDYPVQLIEERGFECIVLGTDWRDMESELETLGELIEKEGIDFLLTDSYQVTQKYLERLTQLTGTIYLDDINAFKYPVDALIVYADYYKKWNPEQIYGDGKTHTKLILGTDFVPLRREFEGMPKPAIADEIKNVLVMSGGSDSYGIIEKMLEALAGEVNVTAICGRFYEKYDELCEKFKDNSGVHILKAVPNLIEYIQNADFCITAGGTTLYEICACGTCAATYSFADNQIGNVRQFEEEGLMPYLGDARYTDSDGHSIYENAKAVLEKYGSAEARKEISAKMQSKIDGKGAQRIVRTIFGMQ